MHRIHLFLLFFSILSFSQTHTITGVVSDDINKPLESANVIAKPLRKKRVLNLPLQITKVDIV